MLSAIMLDLCVCLYYHQAGDDDDEDSEEEDDGVKTFSVPHVIALLALQDVLLRTEEMPVTASRCSSYRGRAINLPHRS